MLLGKVKWFDNKKGFGFIIPIDKEEIKNGDVFVHHKRIEKNGFKTLKEDQLVSYTKKDTENGVMAENVKIVETSSYEAMENIISELLLLNSKDNSEMAKELSYIITQILTMEKVKNNSILLTKENIEEKTDFDFLKKIKEESDDNLKVKKSIEVYFNKVSKEDHEEIRKEIIINI